jgi:hypothetical protein
MSGPFEKKLEEWIIMDNQIKNLNEQIKAMRDKKNNMNNEIIQFVENNNLLNTKIQIHNNNIKFVNTNISPSITFKYLEQCLHEIIKNEIQVKKIIEYIKQKREIKQQIEIKRI